VVTVKILKRKDASSVALAVVLAIMLVSFVQVVTQDLAVRLSNLGSSTNLSLNASGNSWRVNYFNPLVQLVLELVVLEVFCWLAVTLHPYFVRKRK